jgi:DNA-binding response OmpR family regulator
MGKGTTFHIYLPATPDMAIHRNIVVDNSGRRDPVLIMDDEACIRETIGIALTNSGFDVVTAKDGQEALELFSEVFKGNNPFIFTMESPEYKLEGFNYARSITSNLTKAVVTICCITISSL